jgi:geranylgeranyl pyrophosphate synthase
VQKPQETKRRSRVRVVADSDLVILVGSYRELLPMGPGVEPALAAALRDIVDHPGSMIRGQIAWALLTEGQRHPDSTLATRVSIALEYFHAASLVFDDLPSMDDAALRRGRPCPHREWGEGIAILAALALVNRAYELVWSAIAPLPARRRAQAAALIAGCLGVDGILGGQARDLGFRRDTGTAGEALAAVEGKTVALIRLTLLLPAMLDDAAAPVREQLDEIAHRWGLAYQILDDFHDQLAESHETGKTAHRDDVLGRPSLLRLAGAGRALEDLDRQLTVARSVIGRLTSEYRPATALMPAQAFLEREAVTVREKLAAATTR